MVHPQEWIVSLLVLCLLAYLRTVHYTQGSWFGMDDQWTTAAENYNYNPFQDYNQQEQVWETLAKYCAVDLEMLCANQAQEFIRMDECDEAYGPFLSRKMNMKRPVYNGSFQPRGGSGPSRTVRDMVFWYNTDGSRVSATTTSTVSVSRQPEPRDNNQSPNVADVHACGLDMQLQLRGWPPLEKTDLEPYLYNATLLQKNKEALSVARVAGQVLLPTTLRNFYTCGNERPNPFDVTLHPFNTARPSDEDVLRLYEFYMEQLLDVFATPMAAAVEHRLVVSTTTWTRAELVDIVLSTWQSRRSITEQQRQTLFAAMMQKEENGENGKEKLSLQRRLPASRPVDSVVVNAIEERAAIENANVKHAFHLFPCNHNVDQCMYSHFESNTLITDGCAKRMIQAQTKMKEIVFCPISSDFMVFVHMMFLASNLVGMLILVQACSLHKRMKKRLDKKRRQLEQELSDPFLRDSLERKAQKLPAKEREQFFAGLERTIQTWDSSARATRHTKLWMRRLRFVILLAISLNLAFGLLLVKWQVESQAMLFESLITGVLVLTLSYAMKIPTAKVAAADHKAQPLQIATKEMSLLDPVECYSDVNDCQSGTV